MKYKEYLAAARKHIETCRVLIIELEILSGKNLSGQEKAKFKRLTINLYYLSGYIVECSVKYGIFCLYEHPPEKKVNQFSAGDYTYDSIIKVHRFNRYVEAFNKKKGGVVLLDNKNGIAREVLNLYQTWDAEVRYVAKDIPTHFKLCSEYNYIKKFNEYAVKIFEEIQLIR